MPTINMPFVSIILPIRNEAGFIEKCVGSILNNDYPADRMEVIVIDGMSDDATREKVQGLAQSDSRVHLLDNPRRIVPYAMNIGIRQANGEIIIRIDGHALVAADFVSRNVQAIADHPEAWCVGGPVETVSSTYVGRTIAAAMSTPAGVGNAMFRLGNYEGYVDTIAFGAYHRWVFDRIGLFDEELIRNQDDELNMRLVKAGGKIYMTQSIRSQYFPRASLRKLARQYYQYGFWRIRTIQKHRQPATLRQIAPLVFVLGWMVLGAAALAWHPAIWALGGYATMYGLLMIVGMIQVMRKAHLAEALLAPIVFAILHFTYGFGSLRGLVHFVILRRGGRVKPEDYSLSR